MAAARPAGGPRPRGLRLAAALAAPWLAAAGDAAAAARLPSTALRGPAHDLQAQQDVDLPTASPQVSQRASPQGRTTTAAVSSTAGPRLEGPGLDLELIDGTPPPGQFISPQTPTTMAAASSAAGRSHDGLGLAWDLSKTAPSASERTSLHASTTTAAASSAAGSSVETQALALKLAKAAPPATQFVSSQVPATNAAVSSSAGPSLEGQGLALEPPEAATPPIQLTRSQTSMTTAPASVSESSLEALDLSTAGPPSRQSTSTQPSINTATVNTAAMPPPESLELPRVATPASPLASPRSSSQTAVAISAARPGLEGKASGLEAPTKVPPASQFTNAHGITTSAANAPARPSLEGLGLGLEHDKTGEKLSMEAKITTTEEAASLTDSQTRSGMGVADLQPTADPALTTDGDGGSEDEDSEDEDSQAVETAARKEERQVQKGEQDKLLHQNTLHGLGTAVDQASGIGAQTQSATSRGRSSIGPVKANLAEQNASATQPAMLAVSGGRESDAEAGQKHQDQEGPQQEEKAWPHRNDTDDSPSVGGTGVLPLPCTGFGDFSLSSSDPRPGAIYLVSFNGWLHDTPYQATIACIALLTGMFCAWDGAGVWRMLFTASAAAAAAGVVRFEAQGHELSSTAASEIVLMIQAAAAVALATHMGFEGSQVLLGASVGYAGAYGCGAWARSADHALPGLSLLWYTLGAAGGVLVFTLWRRPVLAALAPLLGGLLAASGAGVLASRGCELAAGPANATRTAALPPPDEPWAAAAAALLGPGGGGALLAWHGSCALAALVLHGCRGERRLAAVACLVGCIAATALGAYANANCEAEGSNNCLAWPGVSGEGHAAQPDGWKWQVCGCTAWALLTAVSAWRQLGMHAGAKASSYWEGDLAAELPSRFRYSQLPGAAALDEPLETNHTNGGGNFASGSPNRVQIVSSRADEGRYSLSEWLSSQRGARASRR